MLGRGLGLKTSSLLVPFLLVKYLKNFKKLVDHLNKYGPFTDFQYCFRFSGSTANLFTVIYGRTNFLTSWFHTFLLYSNDLPNDVIFDVAVYTDDTTIYSKYHQVSGLWQQLKLASELKSDQ